MYFISLSDFFCPGRLNEAPVTGYGKDVGTKTTIRITYPEGAIQKPENYEKDSLFVFSAFKPLDFKWLRQMVFKEKLVRIYRTSLLEKETHAGFSLVCIDCCTCLLTQQLSVTTHNPKR